MLALRAGLRHQRVYARQILSPQHWRWALQRGITMEFAAAAAPEVGSDAAPADEPSHSTAGTGFDGPSAGSAGGVGTLLVHHPACEMHDIPGHLECPRRYTSIMKAIREHFPDMAPVEAPRVTEGELARFHAPKLIQNVFDMCEASEQTGKLAMIECDTFVCPLSREAIMRAAGAACFSAREVASGRAANAFACVRPPGHHATVHTSMGFCMFSNIGVAAMLAHEELGMERVAVVDFDVHHGNGTQDLLQTLPWAFFASTHIGYGYYPGTGNVSETGRFHNVVNVPLREGAGTEEFRAAYLDKIFPALREFRPDMIFVSAGFDAHMDDPIGEMELDEDDFSWVTRELCAIAADACQGRIVSILEGGYNIEAISASAVAHVQALRDAAASAVLAGTASTSAAAAAAREVVAAVVHAATATAEAAAIAAPLAAGGGAAPAAAAEPPPRPAVASAAVV